MLFSIVVNSYNRVNSLDKTLRSLTQLRWSEFEIIVITGPSEDGSLALMESWLPRIKHAICPFANLARSRNQGLALASGEWIAFIDDDAMPEPDWLCRLAAYTHEAQIGALGGFVIDHTGKQYQSQYLVSNLLGKTKNYTDLFATPLFSRADSEYYPSLMGVNTCFRRKALEAIGGFDQAYAYYLEETDIILRLHQAHWQTRCIPDALVHHKFADSHIRHEHIVTSLYHIMRSRAYFVCRHALAKYGLAAYAETISADLIELVQHQQANQAMQTGVSAESLKNESYAALLDGLKMAQESIDIPKLSQQLPPALPFKALLSAEQRLHVCLVSRSYPPNAMGGVARFIQTLAKALVKMGHEITVIAETPYAKATLDWEAGVWVHRIKALTQAEKATLTRPSNVPALPESIDAFAAAVWREVHDYQPQRQFHAALGSIWDLDMAWLIGAQSLPIWMYLVTSYHHMQDKDEWQTPEQYKALLQPMLVAEKWALQHCHILASTKAIARDTAHLTQIPALADSQVIPFGLDAREEQPRGQVLYRAAKPHDTRPDPLELPTAFRLLYVGRFEERKGIDCLLAVVPALVQKYPQLQIQLIGNDQLAWQDGIPLRQQFERDYPDCLAQVHFLGEVSETRLQQAYQTCDVFIAPSRYESFGLIYVEAMRAGKACIGTNIGGIPEVIEQDVTGLLVPPDDTQALQVAIEDLLAHPDKVALMGKNARTTFEQKYSAAIFAKNISKVIAEVCQVSQRGQVFHCCGKAAQ